MSDPKIEDISWRANIDYNQTQLTELSPRFFNKYKEAKQNDFR